MTPPARQKMQALVRKAGNQVVRRRFTSIPELTALVYSSLVEYLVNAGVIRTRPFDASACPDAAIGDLSRKKVAEFLARAQAERGYALGPKTPIQKALAHLNLLDNGRPSHAAVLLFGKQPQRFLITSEVKCLHFHGTTIAKPIPSYQIYKGTVFELVDQAVDFVMSKIAAAVGTRAESNQAPVTYELPRPAVAEAIVNAIAHRDYASNASVQVMLFADRLEVWNPGQLPPSLTPEALRSPHASIPHNPLIAEPLFLTRYVEKAGTGILDMISLCKAAGVRAAPVPAGGRPVHPDLMAAGNSGDRASRARTEDRCRRDFTRNCRRTRHTRRASHRASRRAIRRSARCGCQPGHAARRSSGNRGNEASGALSEGLRRSPGNGRVAPTHHPRQTHQPPSEVSCHQQGPCLARRVPAGHGRHKIGHESAKSDSGLAPSEGRHREMSTNCGSNGTILRADVARLTWHCDKFTKNCRTLKLHDHGFEER